VDVGGGRRLNLHCREAGSPAVIFDSGLNDSTIAWALVQPAISKTNATCSYDRAGMGFSDAANYKKPEELIGENGLLEQLTKLLVERAPDTEMAEHLGNI
jgi:pimeloyl-ACP methyl ester carboxylesterase